jgi:hypothetical protein
MDFGWVGYFKNHHPEDLDGPLGVQLSVGLGFGYQRAKIETSTSINEK